MPWKHWELLPSKKLDLTWFDHGNIGNFNHRIVRPVSPSWAPSFTQHVGLSTILASWQASTLHPIVLAASSDDPRGWRWAKTNCWSRLTTSWFFFTVKGDVNHQETWGFHLFHLQKWDWNGRKGNWTFKHENWTIKKMDFVRDLRSKNWDVLRARVEVWLSNLRIQATHLDLSMFKRPKWVADGQQFGFASRRNWQIETSHVWSRHSVHGAKDCQSIISCTLCVCVFIYICVYMYMYIYLYMFMHIYIYTHIHIHIYIYCIYICMYIVYIYALCLSNAL